MAIPDIGTKPAGAGVSGSMPDGASPPSVSAQGDGPSTIRQDGWVWQKAPVYGGLFKDEIIGYEWSPIGRDDSAGGGSGRNDRLTAAMGSLNAYLQASAGADARRMEAFDQFRQLSEFALPPGATTAPGYGPGESAHAFAAGIGMPTYTPPPVKGVPINPQKIAEPAPIPPEVLKMISAIGGAGG